LGSASNAGPKTELGMRGSMRKGPCCGSEEITFLGLRDTEIGIRTSDLCSWLEKENGLELDDERMSEFRGLRMSKAAVRSSVPCLQIERCA